MFKYYTHNFSDCDFLGILLFSFVGFAANLCGKSWLAYVRYSLFDFVFVLFFRVLVILLYFSICRVLCRWRSRQIGIGPILYGFIACSSFSSLTYFTIFICISHLVVQTQVYNLIVRIHSRILFSSFVSYVFYLPYIFIQHVWLTVDVLLSFVIYTRSHLHTHNSVPLCCTSFAAARSLSLEHGILMQLRKGGK